jgi:hypothetical protein
MAIRIFISGPRALLFKLVLWDHWEQDVRGMLLVMEDGLFRLDEACFFFVVAAGIQVPGEERE